MIRLFARAGLAIALVAALGCTTSRPADNAPEHVLLSADATNSAPLLDDHSEAAVRRIDAPGLSNTYRISSTLYRGAQPDEQGFVKLKAMGVRTVVDFRDDSGDEAALCRKLGLNFVAIGCQVWNFDDHDVSTFLKAVTVPQDGAVFVHCKRGADRTGMMIAVYRVVVDGWDKERAIAEMRSHYSFNELLGNLPAYVRRLDVDRFRREAGLDKPVTPSAAATPTLAAATK